jgi:biotin synthase
MAQVDWNDILERGLRGEGIRPDEAEQIVALPEGAEFDRMLEVANALRMAFKGHYVNTCGITNAKSGRCPEKCSFCSQSAHFETESPTWDLKDTATITAEARQAAANGVREFSIVASGRAITSRTELDSLKNTFRQIREETGLQTCASLGLMTKEALAELKEAGMESFHHNLETARSYHSEIVETHSYDDEVACIRAAKELGMYVCCGGIFGMGESWAQRIELATDLRELDVDSVPINFLNPRPGTPLADRHDLTPADCLKIIAMLRLMLPAKDLIVCGGREVNLGDRQHEIFQAGANGLMLGDYLTTAGRDTCADREMLKAQGLEIRPAPHA